MGKKFVVRLTEQQLADVIANQIISKSDDFIKGLSKKPRTDKTDTSSKDSDLESYVDKEPSETRGKFPNLNLNNPEEFRAYQEIADRFIKSRPSNLLNISGSMLADSAKRAQNRFGNYVPVELALAQLSQEGGFSNNPKSRPIRTKNPFNVGNIDSGENVYHNSVQNGIQSYYNLIARSYLGDGKTSDDLLKNFVNKRGNRYASDRNYENSISRISNQVHSISQQVYATLLNKKDTKNLA